MKTQLVTRFLSIVAFAIVALAAQESLFVQQAFAGTKCCKAGNISCTCVATACPSTFPLPAGTCPLPYATGNSSGSSSGTVNSTIRCDDIPNSGINNVDFVPGNPETETSDSFAAAQSFLQTCRLTTDAGPSDPATCQFDILYSGPTNASTTCHPPVEGSTSTLTLTAFCGDPGLQVAGTLNCNLENKTGADLPDLCWKSRGVPVNSEDTNPNCTMRLGIQGCTGVFQSTEDDNAFLADQVLKTEVRTNNATCTGQVVGHDDILTRYCNSGKFDATPAGTGGTSPNCIFSSGEVQLLSTDVPQTITQTETVYLPIDVEVNPNSINTKCGTKKDQGEVKFTISASETLDVANIDIASLQAEVGGAFGSPDDTFPLTGCKLSGQKLTCRVNSCPDLGPSLADPTHRDANGQVDIRVTGKLKGGTEISGEDNVKTSP